MHADCIFCRITHQEIATEFIASNEHAVVFKDINPRASVHFLIVPKEHIINLNQVNSGHQKILWAMLNLVQEVARVHGSGDDSGFRLLANNGASAGQVVHHMHWHFLVGVKKDLLPQ